MSSLIGALIFLAFMAGVLISCHAESPLLAIWNGLKNVIDLAARYVRPHPKVVKPLDVAAARRESHALGLPFPEADGTLSRPGLNGAVRSKTDAEVHAEIHRRRMVAQFGVTVDEAARALRDVLHRDAPSEMEAQYKALYAKPLPPRIDALEMAGQKDAWMALVHDMGWTCAAHSSCDLNTPTCRIIMRG